MENRSKSSSNVCTGSQSLSTVLRSSTGVFQLHPSHSLPSCVKINTQKSYSQPPQMIPTVNLENLQKKKSNPTIGELLGDNDLFHSQYHHQYSSRRCKQKRHHHLSQPRSSHFHTYRKRRRSTCYNNVQESSFRKAIEPVSETDQIYQYPTNYTYPPFSAYCYHCYSNSTAYCPYIISDCYTGFYQQEMYYETSTI